MTVSAFAPNTALEMNASGGTVLSVLAIIGVASLCDEGIITAPAADVVMAVDQFMFLSVEEQQALVARHAPYKEFSYMLRLIVRSGMIAAAYAGEGNPSIGWA